MFSGLVAVLALTVCPSLSAAVHVYLHPPAAAPPPSAPPADPSALLAHHLRLDPFFPAPDSHGEIVLGASTPFVGEGPRDALILAVDASRAEDIIPDTLRPSFTLSTPSESLLEKYARIAHQAYHAISDLSTDPPPHILPKFLDIFSLSPTSPTRSRILDEFLGSLSALAAFVEDDATDRFGAFQLVGLPALEQEWGRESEVYRTAAASVKATIQSASTRAFSLAVVLSPPPSSLHARQPPQSPLPQPPPDVPATAPVFSTSTCFTTADACRNATATCSSRGQCVGVTRAGRTCFVCQCRNAPLEEGGKNVSWAGSMCQKRDLSQQFSLIAGTVLFLVLVAGGSIALLYAVGGQELPGTLMGGMGGHGKHE